MAIKNNPFKIDSENLPFFPDQKSDTHEPFIGKYMASQVLGDNPDPKENIPVYVFAKMTGEKYFITQSYSIKKAIDHAQKEFGTLNDIVFFFEYKGKSESNGRPFNIFTTGYCTEEEYNLSLEDVDQKTGEVKEKKKK